MGGPASEFHLNDSEFFSTPTLFSKIISFSECLFFFSKLFIYFILGFPGGSVVKNPPASAREQVYSLSQEDSLEKEMATHSSILAWEILRTEEPGRLQSRGLQKRRTRLSN